MEDNKIRKIATSILKLIFIEGVFLYLFNYLMDVIGLKNIVSSFFHSKKLLSFLSYSIPLWEVIVSFIVFIILILLFSFFRTKSNSKTIKTRQEKIYDLIDRFKIEFKFMDGKTNGVQYRTDLTMSNENIILQNIQPYCLCHEIKLKMGYAESFIDVYKIIGYKCPDDECGNLISSDSVEDDKCILLSKLENYWDKSIKEMN